MIIKVKKKKKDFFKDLNLQDIEKIYGLHACVSVLNNKQRNIIEVLCTDDTLQKIRDKINNLKYLNNLKVLKRKRS